MQGFDATATRVVFCRRQLGIDARVGFVRVYFGDRSTDPVRISPASGRMSIVSQRTEPLRMSAPITG